MARVLSYISLFFSLIGTLLGANFITGSTPISFIIAIVVVIGLYFVGDLRETHKTATKKNSTKSLILLTGYIIFLIPTLYFTQQGVNIALLQREEIQEQARQKVIEVDSMYSAYEDAYQLELQSMKARFENSIAALPNDQSKEAILRAKPFKQDANAIAEFQNNPSPFVVQTKISVFLTIRDSLYRKSIADMSQDTTYFQQVRSTVVESFNPLLAGNLIRDLDNRLHSTLKKLQMAFDNGTEGYSRNGDSKPDTFEFKLSSKVMTNITNPALFLTSSPVNIGFLTIILILQSLFLILPYWIAGNGGSYMNRVQNKPPSGGREI